MRPGSNFGVGTTEKISDSRLYELAHRDAMGLAVRLQSLICITAYANTPPSLFLGHEALIRYHLGVVKTKLLLLVRSSPD